MKGLIMAVPQLVVAVSCLVSALAIRKMGQTGGFGGLWAQYQLTVFQLLNVAYAVDYGWGALARFVPDLPLQGGVDSAVSVFAVGSAFIMWDRVKNREKYSDGG